MGVALLLYHVSDRKNMTLRREAALRFSLSSRALSMQVSLEKTARRTRVLYSRFRVRCVGGGGAAPHQATPTVETKSEMPHALLVDSRVTSSLSYDQLHVDAYSATSHVDVCARAAPRLPSQLSAVARKPAPLTTPARTRGVAPRARLVSSLVSRLVSPLSSRLPDASRRFLAREHRSPSTAVRGEQPCEKSCNAYLGGGVWVRLAGAYGAVGARGVDCRFD